MLPGRLSSNIPWKCLIFFFQFPFFLGDGWVQVLFSWENLGCIWFIKFLDHLGAYHRSYLSEELNRKISQYYYLTVSFLLVGVCHKIVFHVKPFDFVLLCLSCFIFSILPPNTGIMFLSVYFFPFDSCLCIRVHHTNPSLWLSVTQYIIKVDALCATCVEALVISLSSQTKLMFFLSLFVFPSHISSRCKLSTF